MRLERLELKGFCCFVNPIILDLQDRPAGLVAITGANGEGKTTLLDSAVGATHLLFPSRDGTLADYAVSRDAYIDALFSFSGRGLYRTRVNVDGERRNSDAVLELIQPDGAHVALNDGKVSTFRDQIAEVFPPKDVLLASAFSAQNRSGSFVTLPVKGRKELFSSLLGLSHYETMAETARACSRLTTEARTALLAAIEIVARDADPSVLGALRETEGRIMDARETASHARVVLQDALEGLEAERNDLAEDAAKHFEALAKVSGFMSVVAQHEGDLVRLAADIKTASALAGADEMNVVTRCKALVADLTARITKETEACAAAVHGLDERIAGNQTLSANADTIRAAAAARVETEDTLRRLRVEQDRLLAELEALLAEERGWAPEFAAVQALDRDLRGARAGAEIIGTVPCEAAGPYAACQFLTNAVFAQARIAELEAELARRAPAFDQRADANAANLTRVRADVAGVLAQINELSARLAADKWSQYATSLAATEERIAGYLREKAAKIEDRDARVSDYGQRMIVAQQERDRDVTALAQRLQMRLDDLTKRQHETDRSLVEARTALTAAHVDVSRTHGASARVDVIDAELSGKRMAWTTNESTLARLDAEQQQIEEAIALYAHRLEDLTERRARVQTVEAELLQWQLLTKALSRDGLPTLEIDAAGPTVSNLTNDLLAVSFGTRFTLEVVTQVERADGKGLREDFSIRVFDNEQGGGERIIVEEALRGAIALFVNSRNAMPIRTCWRDETTGALDGENAVRYIAMLRRIQALGGFSHLLFITHNPDCAALADARVVVANGTLTWQEAA